MTSPGNEIITSMDIYEYIPEANRDGYNIRFAHAANEEETLSLALQGKVSLIRLQYSQNFHCVLISKICTSLKDYVS